MNTKSLFLDRSDPSQYAEFLAGNFCYTTNTDNLIHYSVVLCIRNVPGFFTTKFNTGSEQYAANIADNMNKKMNKGKKEIAEIIISTMDLSSFRSEE